MSSFFERLLGRREPSSADMARERLKLVLVTDRSDLSPEKLEQMQLEIIQVMKRYLQIDEASVNIKLEQRDRTNYLVADIPLARDHVPYDPFEAAQLLEKEEAASTEGKITPLEPPDTLDDTKPTKPAGEV